MCRYQRTNGRQVWQLAFLIAVAWVARGLAVPPSPQPQLQGDVPQMLAIEWSAAPPMPQGMQDNDGGIIDHYLIMVGGFCHGIDDDWKVGKYPRGFLNKAWGLDLDEPSRGWFEIPNFPGSPRQEMYGLSRNNEIYLWGGFNYTPPYAYTDGYKLTRQHNEWVWSPLPPLARPAGAGNVAAIGENIYLIGGMDYDSQRYYVTTDRTGKIERYGARLYVFNTAQPTNGWQELKMCPGTPRMMSGVTGLEGQLYVIGGYGVDPEGGAHSVVDSWRYDPAADAWHRLRDLPVSVSGFGSGEITYQGRYLLLPTGYPHPTVLNPDGTVRPRYGKPSKIDRSQWKQHPRLAGMTYENHVWVYDTQTDLYGTATPLPYDDHGPATHIIGDTVYMFPGETAGFWWQGEYFGHAPEFVLRGKISLLNWQ